MSDFLVLDRWFVPMQIKSQNVFLYSHWRKYKKYKDAWFNAIGKICRKGEHNNQPQSIKITSIRKRLLDKGNLIGGAKPIPDALKKYGHIVDDSPKWVEIDYHQRKSEKGEETGTVIEIGLYHDERNNQWDIQQTLKAN